MTKQTELIIFSQVPAISDTGIQGIMLLYAFTNVGRAILFSACRSVGGRSNLVIFNKISSQFYLWMAFIKLLFKFEYSLRKSNKMHAKPCILSLFPNSFNKFNKALALM